ncbi:MAG: hypothetical protein ACYS7Y_04030 [Planctomycetota bacterium]|jgi:hypothetical protein
MPKPTKADFAQALNCREKFIGVRLVALGHSDCCSRCGGSGEYSFNQMDGTRCYGCGGVGQKPKRLTIKLLAQVKQDVADGKMQPYLDAMKARGAAKKASQEFFCAWGDNPIVKQYEGVHFTQCPEEHHAVNFCCSELSDAVHNLIYRIQYEKGLSNETLVLLGSVVDKGIELARGAQAELERRGDLTRENGRALGKEYVEKLQGMV